MKLPPGALLIFGLAIVSTALVMCLPSKAPGGITFWVYHIPNRDAYSEPIERWNKGHPESRFEISVLHANALE